MKREEKKSCSLFSRDVTKEAEDAYLQEAKRFRSCQVGRGVWSVQRYGREAGRKSRLDVPRPDRSHYLCRCW